MIDIGKINIRNISNIDISRAVGTYTVYENESFYVVIDFLYHYTGSVNLFLTLYSTAKNYSRGKGKSLSLSGGGNREEKFNFSISGYTGYLNLMIQFLDSNKKNIISPIIINNFLNVLEPEVSASIIGVSHKIISGIFVGVDVGIAYKTSGKTVDFTVKTTLYDKSSGEGYSCSDTITVTGTGTKTVSLLCPPDVKPSGHYNAHVIIVYNNKTIASKTINDFM